MKGCIGKNLINCFIVMFIGMAVGTGLLVLAFLIPVNEEQAGKSLDIILEEDSYPAIPVIGDLSGMSSQSFSPGVLDNSTDEIMLFTALDMGRADQGALVRSMNMYNGYMGREYPYYWHGYVAVLRPLLCILSYSDLRFVNGLLQLILIYVLVRKVRQKRGRIYGIMMFTSYVLLMPLALMFSLQYTWVFYIATLAALLLICKGDQAAGGQRYVLVFLVTGMLTSYFDLLTYPLFTWGFPLLWWLMTREPARKCGKAVLEVIVSGISWIFGYAVFWAGKWCLGTLILKQDIIRMAMDEIFLRAGVEEKLSMAERFGAAYINWKHYGYCVYALILLAWLAWGLVKLVRKGWHVDNNIFAYSLVGLSSVVWYCVLANHTTVHHFFTYRIYNVGILAFLAIWAGAFGAAEPECGFRRNAWKTELPVLLLIGVGAVGGAFLARDDIWATNGYASYQGIMLSGQDVLSQEFRPTFPRIKEFGICANPSAESGMIEITIWEGENAIGRESFSLKGWGEEAYHTIPVDWKFRRNGSYVLELRLLENDGTVEILATEGGESPLSEYGILRLNGENMEGQLISGITYWHYPTSKRFLLYLAFTWAGVLSCAALVLYASCKHSLLARISR